MIYDYVDSPIGSLLLAGNDRLSLIGFPRGSKARRADIEWRQRRGAFREAAQQLEEYFAGDRKTFELDLEVTGTPFQQAVLGALALIPYGELRTYKDIAEDIGRPKAVRAVGAANGANPLPIVLPCHRVVGSNGKLTGFGGGLPAKRYLLELEGNRSGLFA